jgi:hypothetical protein
MEGYTACIKTGMIPQFIRRIISETLILQQQAQHWMETHANSGLAPPFDSGIYESILDSLYKVKREWLACGLPSIVFPDALLERGKKQRADAAAKAAKEAEAQQEELKAQRAQELASAKPLFLQLQVVQVDGSRAASGDVEGSSVWPGVADMDELDCKPHACRMMPSTTPADTLMDTSPSMLQGGPVKRKRSAALPGHEGKQHKVQDNAWSLQES